MKVLIDSTKPGYGYQLQLKSDRLTCGSVTQNEMDVNTVAMTEEKREKMKKQLEITKICFDAR